MPFPPRLPMLVWSPLLLLAVAFPINLHGAAAQRGAASRNAPAPAPLSAASRAFLARPIDRPAFEQGLALLKDSTESPAARRQILDKLHGARKTLDAGQLRTLRRESAALAQDSQSPPELAAQAIGTMTSANLLLLERGEITTATAQQDAPFLLGAARDAGKAPELRGRAIRALADLRADEAAPVLRRLLEDPANDNLPEVARNASLGLARLSPGTALPAVAGMMARTADPAVFGSGAFALGRLKSPEAMAALVQLERRFPDSTSADAALSEMPGVILAVLRRPGDPQLPQAIAATRHLWKKSQREQYLPLLRGLLRSAQPAMRAQALERLLDAAGTLDFAAETRELEAILPLVADQPDLAAYAARIRQRLAAQPLAPTGQTIPVPPATGLN